MRKLSELSEKEKKELFEFCVICGVELNEETESFTVGLCNLCVECDEYTIEQRLEKLDKELEKKGILVEE